MSLERAIERERHDAEMSRLGLHPQNLDRHERRLKELYAKRERLFQQDLAAAAALERMTAPKPAKPTPPWLRWLTADEYLDSRGDVRTQKYDEYHH